MKLEVLSILLLSIIQIQAWRIFHRGRIVGGNVGEPRTKQERQTSEGEEWYERATEEYFSQKLDHFDPTNTKTWLQRYFGNDQFYNSADGGPVFLMIGGEGDATVKWMVKGAWIDYAQAYGAYLFELEHRFYGKSQPTEVVFGVTCSPYLLGAVINYHLEQCLSNTQQNYSTSTISRLLKSFYVDNCVTSLDTEEDLQKFIKESKAVMSEAQFDLRLWESTILTQEADVTDSQVSSVLGLNWNKNLDTLEIAFTGFDHLKTEAVTKKLILSVANSVFDPNGFACPVLLEPKKLLQQTWILKLDWNKEVPDNIRDVFLEWLKNVHLLKCIKIPRWILKETSENIVSWQLHLFCDASKEAYASAVFLRTTSKNEVSVQLIQAKSRVSPIKAISIPRLELLAATIGTRLLISVRKNLEIDNVKIFCWSDSTTVISWIKRQDTWKPFVKNRVDEICKSVKPECWYHVPGPHNIADLPSRGCSAQQLLKSCWWEGPQWLKEDPAYWPQQEYEVDEDIVVEEKRKETKILILKSIDFTWYHSERFSSYQKLLRVIAWIQRFVFNCRYQKEERRQQNLIVNEINNAEIYVLKMVQTECFEGKEDKRISSLMPFYDQNNLLRVTTKISERKDLENFRYPILLPAKHHVVRMIIYEYHITSYHIGVQSLLKTLREKFWIIGGRKTIKSVISKCITCRKFDARKTEAPLVPLPEDRVRDALVFEIIGMDFAGPLYLRNKEKVWISIFTCAVYRAVHLELVVSLSTESFLQAFRRFIARRGRPSVIYSDNATNYRGAENAFNTIDWDEIEKQSTTRKIKWKFSPPTAAWWGGWWERLIRTLKQMLRKVLGKACLTYEELSSIVCECEAVMNSRPLTYMSEDINDLTCLSPSMFLQENTEIGTADIETVGASKLVRRYNYRKRVLEDLKKRFRSEYLGCLRMEKRKNVAYQNIKVGSLVLVENDLVKRTEWPLGRIEKVFPGKDHNIRLVQVKTTSGKLLRPIQKIYLLEVNEDNQEIRDGLLKSENKLQQTNEREINVNNKDVLPIIVDKILKEDTRTRCGRKVKPPIKLNL